MAFFDKKTSKLKMVMLTSSTEKNRVWYSPIKYNYKSNEFIISGMLRRFTADKLLPMITNTIHFYENGQLIAEVKL